jgi:DNA-directed RNA polymerase subunit RPC12/RpoP
VSCLERNRLRAETAVSLTRFQYECLTCNVLFVAVRQLKQARCVECGSMSTELRRMTAQPVREAPTPQLVRPASATALPKVAGDGEDLVSKYLCLDCGRPTRWNHTRRGKQTPVCSACKSASVKECSPRVTMLAVVRGQAPEVSRPLTKTEVKRIKFIRRQWRMRCELADQTQIVLSLLDRMGFEGEQISAARETMSRLLVEVDAKQQERIHDYESRAAR